MASKCWQQNKNLNLLSSAYFYRLEIILETIGLNCLNKKMKRIFIKCFFSRSKNNNRISKEASAKITRSNFLKIINRTVRKEILKP